MSKAYNFDWQIEVSARLLKGDYFDRWDEENGTLEQNCLFRVDSYGFFIYWQSEGRDGQVIELSQVSDIRPGKAPTDPKIGADLMANSLVYGRGNIDERTVTICSGIDFVQISHTNITGADPATAKEWIEGLRKITHNHKANNICPTTILRKHWMKISFMLSVNKKIPVRSISKTFASGKTEKRIFEILKELGLPSGKNDEVDPVDFTFEKFCDLYHKICPRTDISALFDELSGGKDYITTKQFVDWLNETQRDPRLNEILFPFYDTNSALRIIDRYELRANYRDRGHLSCDGLTRYLMSDENAPVFLDRLEVYHDMEQPLCHYLINSSHNTYLQGRQFGGRSSVEMYRQVLLAGCRCIELDCWDGKNDTEPIITHGKAMCSDINFKEVICAIRDTAFVTSEYPVILSFENHCSKPQQFKLAKYCEEILGDYLLTKPLDTHPLEPGVPLPSPNLLKRKILIKNKRLKLEVEKKHLDLFLKGLDTEVNNDNDDFAANVEGEDGPAAFIDSVKLREDDDEAHPELNVDINDDVNRRTLLSQLGIKFIGTSKLSKEEEEALLNRYQYKGATTNIHPLLSSRVNYAQPIKFPGFSKAEERNIHYHMSSFSENVALQHLKQNPIEFVNYNKRQMSRIYPKGGRVDSSNYMPQIFWNAGCQMVSLNFQTPDLPMQLNLGKFEYNGNCGYLLKPDFMRRPDRTFDPYAESPVDGVIAAFCSVRVISGQFLSDKKIGTYVEVDMYGLPADTIRKEYRTKTIPANGLNPRYDESVFEFRKIVLPDLAILRIAVYEETGKLIGQRVLPLDGLQAGYRHISLRTEGNFPLSLPTIFCQIILKSYVPDGLSAFVDQLNKPLLIKKTEDLLNSSITNSLDGGQTSSSSSVRRGRVTDSASASTPSLETKSSIITTTGASSISVNTISTTDTNSLASSTIKPKTPIETPVAITLEYLREHKTFCKLKHKQDKEIILMKKKHAKEQTVLGEQQSKIMTKAKVDCEKMTRSPMIHSGNPRKEFSNGGNSPEIKSDPKLMDLTNEQNVEWTSLVQRQLTEMNAVRRQHTKEQCDLLRLLLDDTQKTQIKDITDRHSREKKELELTQVRQNIEDSKRLGSEKNIRNKSELDRRVRELKSNNTKKFVEERKRQTMRQEREKENLLKSHETQKTTLLTEIDKMLEYSLNYQDETPMARFPSSSV